METVLARRRLGACRWLLAAALLAGPFAAEAGAQVRSNGELLAGAWADPGAFEIGVTGWATRWFGFTARGVYRPGAVVHRPDAVHGQRRRPNLRWVAMMFSLRWFWGTRVECNVSFGAFDSRIVAVSGGGSVADETGSYLEYLVGYRIAGRVGLKAGVGIPAINVGTAYPTPKVLGVVSF